VNDFIKSNLRAMLGMVALCILLAACAHHRAPRSSTVTITDESRNPTFREGAARAGETVRVAR
jgi:hypothetical protein